MSWNWPHSHSPFPLWNADEATVEQGSVLQEPEVSSFCSPKHVSLSPKRMVENPSAQCQVAVSADGGVTWEQERLIAKTPWASHPPLGQWLSSVETSSQWVLLPRGAPFADDGCVCFLCSAKPCAGSCGSFNSQLSLGRPWPAQYLPSLWPASGTGPGEC